MTSSSSTNTRRPIYNAVGNVAEGIFNKVSRGKRTADNPATHLVLTGGTYQINRDEDFDELYMKLADHLGVSGVEMISVSENRTMTFPMYFDLDMKLPVPVLTHDAIRAVLCILIRQTLRFYPEDAHGRLGYVVVLDKTGEAPRVSADSALYKHGLHVYFPRLLVDVNRAFQIRIGVLNGLMYHTGSWTEALGTDPGDEWNNIVDEAVYRTGLRMPYSPKATKCRACYGGNCDACKGQNKRHVIDERVYNLCMVLDAHGERDAAEETILKGNMSRFLRACTVRAPSIASVTEGYEIYPGCPQLTSSQLYNVSGVGGGKRKNPLPLASLSGAASKRATERRFTEVLTSPKVNAIVLKYLKRFYEGYADCWTEVRRGGNTVRVALRGDNSKYCINKRGFHRSNNVYMEFVRSGEHARVFMKCYCPCKTSENRQWGHCSSMHTRQDHNSIDRAEVGVLFVSKESEKCDVIEGKESDRCVVIEGNDEEEGAPTSGAKERALKDILDDGEFFLKHVQLEK